tara:strand:- start:78 stop:629 length:552 start_codon:yes stop_codon:yes gene_type:complete
MSSRYSTTQNDLLLSSLMNFYVDKTHLDAIISIINGEGKISLRIIDWFVTNYAKEKYVVYSLNNDRFKVFHEYKLKLKAYSKKRFDPFCRWDRICIPYDEKHNMETTIGQLNFFRWALESNIVKYIEQHYDDIEKDMNSRNTNSRKKQEPANENKTRKKREELSVSACKCIKKENVHIVVKFT